MSVFRVIGGFAGENIGELYLASGMQRNADILQENSEITVHIAQVKATQHKAAVGKMTDGGKTLIIFFFENKEGRAALGILIDGN